MGSKLYVGNLSFDTTEDTLRAAFEADGRSVSEVAIISDRMTGRPRGFAFVTMGSSEDAQKAVEALDGRELDGRTLRVFGSARTHRRRSARWRRRWIRRRWWR